MRTLTQAEQRGATLRQSAQEGCLHPSAARCGITMERDPDGALVLMWRGAGSPCVTVVSRIQDAADWLYWRGVQSCWPLRTPEGKPPAGMFRNPRGELVWGRPAPQLAEAKEVLL